MDYVLPVADAVLTLASGLQLASIQEYVHVGRSDDDVHKLCTVPQVGWMTTAVPGQADLLGEDRREDDCDHSAQLLIRDTLWSLRWLAISRRQITNFAESRKELGYASSAKQELNKAAWIVPVGPKKIKGKVVSEKAKTVIHVRAGGRKRRRRDRKTGVAEATLLMRDDIFSSIWAKLLLVSERHCASLKKIEEEEQEKGAFFQMRRSTRKEYSLNDADKLAELEEEEEEDLDAEVARLFPSNEAEIEALAEAERDGNLLDGLLDESERAQDSRQAAAKAKTKDFKLGLQSATQTPDQDADDLLPDGMKNSSALLENRQLDQLCRLSLLVFEPSVYLSGEQDVEQHNLLSDALLDGLDLFLDKTSVSGMVSAEMERDVSSLLAMKLGQTIHKLGGTNAGGIITTSTNGGGKKSLAATKTLAELQAEAKREVEGEQCSGQDGAVLSTHDLYEDEFFCRKNVTLKDFNLEKTAACSFYGDACPPEDLTDLQLPLEKLIERVDGLLKQFHSEEEGAHPTLAPIRAQAKNILGVSIFSTTPINLLTHLELLRDRSEHWEKQAASFVSLKGYLAFIEKKIVELR